MFLSTSHSRAVLQFRIPNELLLSMTINGFLYLLVVKLDQDSFLVGRILLGSLGFEPPVFCSHIGAAAYNVYAYIFIHSLIVPISLHV